MLKEEKTLEKPEANSDGSVNQTTDDSVSQLPDPEEKEEKTVSYKTYKKTVDELKTVKGKLTKVNKEIDDATEKSLTEQSKFEDLFKAEKTKSEAKDEKLKLKEVKILMQAEGIQDLDYSDILIKKLEFDDNLEAANAKEIFDELREKKPYLFSEGAPIAKTDTNKTKLSQKVRIFTAKEIGEMSSEDYRKNEKAIMEQMSKGLIK